MRDKLSNIFIMVGAILLAGGVYIGTILLLLYLFLLAIGAP